MSEELEKTLNEEEDIEEPSTPPVEDEEEDLGQTGEPEGEEEEKPSAPSIEDITKKMEEMERANEGLRKAITSIRTEKQALAAKLDQLSQMLLQAKEMREKGAKPDQGEAEASIPQKLKVEVTDDGELYIPAENLIPLLKNQIEPVEKTATAVATNVDQMQQQQALQSVVSNVVSSSPEYQKAYSDLIQSYREMVDAAMQKAYEMGVQVSPQTMNAEVAAGLLYDSPFEQKLAQKGISIDDIVLVDRTTDPALFGARLKRVLSKMVGENNKNQANQPDTETLERLANKKKSLVGKKSTSAKSSGLDNLVESLRPIDLLNMPDDKFNEMLSSIGEE